MPALYVGIMSGTSLDGIDLVLVDFGQRPPKLIATHTCAFPAALRAQLATLSQPGENEIERLGLAEAELAICYAEGVHELLKQAGTFAKDVKAIGCHGQTIRHRPEGRFGFTYQIGDMFRLAVQSQIRVISQFRQKDMALGGQGAPLVPAFHQAVFADAAKYRAIINIGGIANVTLLQPNAPVTGFDTGPGNCLLDVWFEQQGLGAYDKDGKFAASGHIQSTLLTRLWQDPYFKRQGPKSTGREHFNRPWLEKALQQEYYAPADVQRTLTRFSAETICYALPAEVSEVYLCGGGVYNLQLRQELQILKPDCLITSTNDLGIHPSFVEAMAFAWLAYAFDENIPSNVPEVTGASQATVLGTAFSH